jgi:hypothetical protein
MQFARRIHGLKERLKKLKFLSLQRKREKYLIIRVWKMLHGAAPNTIGLAFYSNPRLGIRASIPKFNHKAQKSNVKNVKMLFSLNTLKTLESFKTALGGFIVQFPDEPPVTPPNSDSLFDWTACGGHGVCA